MTDQIFMQRAITLARRGGKNTHPNPRVGAVVVKKGRILSEGYHAVFGGPHAEIVAISKLSPDELKDSTLYVTLEPCDHYGKTPPCTENIISSRISHVVVGTRDPNKLVSGKGIEKLNANKIIITEGICSEECRQLNESYFKVHETGRPLVILKIAQTLDGKIAVRKLSNWISCEKSREWVQKMRAKSDVVLIGIRTLIEDNPRLDIRSERIPNCHRIVMDSHLRIPLESQILKHDDPEKTIIATTGCYSKSKFNRLSKLGVRIWSLEANTEGHISLQSLFKKMIENNLYSLLVEGGSEIFTSFLREGVVDKYFCFIAPKLYGKGINVLGDLSVLSPQQAVTFRYSRWRQMGSDILFEGRI